MRVAKNKIISFILFFGLLISSLYIAPSGVPQLSDLFLFVFSLLVLINYSRENYQVLKLRLSKAFIYFTMWTLIVSVTWTVILLEPKVLLHPMYYTYNVIIAISIISFLKKTPTNIKVINNGVKASLVISGIGILATFQGIERTSGFFNNPNQLAYFSLCSLAVLLIINNFKIELSFFSMTSIAAAMLGIFSAASLGGIAGFSILLIVIVISGLSSHRFFIRLTLGLFITISGVLYYDSYTGGELSGNFIQRIERATSKVESLESERGYDRILAFPQYTVLGAAEGRTDRFYPYDSGEIHSTFGTVIFSYGAPGAILFFFMLYQVLKKTSYLIWLTVSAPLVYSITHHGLRTSIFWILLAVVWYISYQKRISLAR